MLRKSEFEERLKTLKSELQLTSLLIVSKGREASEIKAYYELGHRDFGENRVQELSNKAQELKDSCPEIRWHMIGNLQSNKINSLLKIPNLHFIHSVGEVSIVEKLISASKSLDHKLNIFLQIKTSGESEKSGLESEEEISQSAKLLLNSEKLRFYGLMTMGTIRTEEFEEEALRCFKKLNEVKLKLNEQMNLDLKTSMGMSQDYKIAVLEKSDWVRIGTRMFV